MLVCRIWQVKRIKETPFPAQRFTFASQPPSDALRGKIVLAEGLVEKKARDKEEPEESGVDEEIIQGEDLATGEESQAVVEFFNLVRIGLASNTKISLISLIPAQFLIHLPFGSLDYQLHHNNGSISIRCLHTLLAIDSGEGKVEVKEGEIVIEIFSGQARLALVDLDNHTQLWEVKGGEKIFVDDLQRTVQIGESESPDLSRE